MTIYDYQELKNKALSTDATQNDINNLGEWFEQYEQYGNKHWNGEYYSVDGRRLYPIYRRIDDDELEEQYEIIGYEIR